MVVVNQLEGIAKRWRYKRDNIIFSHKHLTFSRYRFICLEKKKNECLEKKKAFLIPLYLSFCFYFYHKRVFL